MCDGFKEEILIVFVKCIGVMNGLGFLSVFYVIGKVILFFIW